MKNVNQEVIEIIKANINLKNNDILWLKEIRDYNLPSATILVLIDKARK